MAIKKMVDIWTLSFVTSKYIC